MLGEHQSNFKKAADCIIAGGVIAYPTEACFGIGCNPDNETALKRIMVLKKRSPDKGFILVTDALDRVAKYIKWSALDATQQKSVLTSWPGPVTWLIPSAQDCNHYLTGKHTTLAIRVPDFAPIQKLCKLTKSSLVSTSANLSGQPPLKTAEQVREILGDQLDFIVDQNIAGIQNPSQIIDAVSGKKIRS